MDRERIIDLVYERAAMVLPRTVRRGLGARVRKTYEKRIGYRGYHVSSATYANDWISQRLQSGEPAAIGKIGGFECRAIGKFIRYGGRIDKWDMWTKHFLYVNAGVFPLDDGILYRFCLEFLDSLRSLDLIAACYNPHESTIVKTYAVNADLVEEFEALEPFWHKNPWTRYLEKKKVLVIHPFEQSIRRQYGYRDKIWQDERCLPIFELDTIKVPLSAALAKSGFEDWFDALQHIMARISEKEFDAAIVGAGAYSIPLVARIKKMGKFAIHLGGATQLLFGIKGKRWDNHRFGLRFYNDSWSRPLQEETPPDSRIVEEGCYW
jgi:hypothetical protein